MAIQGEQIGTAVLVLTTDAAGLEKGLTDAKQRTQRSVADLNAIGTRMQSVGAKLSVAVTAPLVAMAVKSVQAQAQQEEAVAKLAQAVINAGRQGEIAIANLEAHATKMQGITRFGDDVQLDAMAVIEALTGVGETTLIELTTAAMNMSAALDRDLGTVAEQLAKYVSGASEEIRGLDIDGKITDPANRAQAAIELIRQKFDGVAEAEGKVGLGPWEIFLNRLSDIGKKFGEVLIPQLNTFLDKLDGIVTWFENLNPEAVKFLVTFGAIAAVAGPGLMFLGTIVKAAPAIGAAVTTLTGVFGSLATALGGLVGGAGAGVAAGVIGGPFGLAIAAFAALASAMDQKVAKPIAYWLMDVAAPKISEFCGNVAQWFVNLATKIADAITSITQSIKEWVGEKLEAARGKVAEWADAIKGKFEWLWDKLSRHSIVPDMVKDILGWMERLAQGMKDWSTEGTEGATSIFQAFVWKIKRLNRENEAGLDAGFQPVFGTGGNMRGPGGSIAGAREGGGGGEAILSILGRVGQAFLNMITGSEVFQKMLERLNTVLAPLVEQIVTPLVNALVESGFLDLLVRLVSGIMPTLVSVFESLGSFLEVTMPFWDALGKIVVATGAIFGWLVQKVIAFGKVLYYAVTFQWGKIGGVDWGGSLTAALDTAMAAYGSAASVPTAAAGATGTTTTISGTGATYQQARPINVTVDLHDNTIAGDGSFRQLALTIRRELESLDVLGI